jgi:hypothetical protein
MFFTDEGFAEAFLTVCIGLLKNSTDSRFKMI